MADKQITIRGSIRQKSTNRPIEGLLVKALDSEKSTSKIIGKTKTNLDGRYKLEINEKHLGKLLAESKANMVLNIIYDDHNNPIAIHDLDLDKTTTDIYVDIPVEFSDPRFRVSGHVTTHNGLGVDGLSIKIFDKKAFKKLVPLGHATTDFKGGYLIEYSRKAKQSNVHNYDLIIQCLDKDNEILDKKPLISNAEKQVIADFKVSNQYNPKPSRFSELKAALDPFLSDKNAKELNDISADDIDYLATKLKLKINVINHYIFSNLLHTEIEKAAKVKQDYLKANKTTKSPLPQGISIEILFALIKKQPAKDYSSSYEQFKQFLNQDTDQVKTTAKTALLAAVKNSEIDYIADEQLANIVESILQIKLAFSYVTQKTENHISLSALVGELDMTKANHNQLIETLVLETPGSDAFWKIVNDQNVLSKHTAAIKELLELLDLTKQNFYLT